MSSNIGEISYIATTKNGYDTYPESAYNAFKHFYTNSKKGWLLEVEKSSQKTRYTYVIYDIQTAVEKGRLGSFFGISIDFIGCYFSDFKTYLEIMHSIVNSFIQEEKCLSKDPRNNQTSVIPFKLSKEKEYLDKKSETIRKTIIEDFKKHLKDLRKVNNSTKNFCEMNPESSSLAMKEMFEDFGAIRLSPEFPKAIDSKTKNDLERESLIKELNLRKAELTDLKNENSNLKMVFGQVKNKLANQENHIRTLEFENARLNSVLVEKEDIMRKIISLARDDSRLNQDLPINKPLNNLQPVIPPVPGGEIAGQGDNGGNVPKSNFSLLTLGKRSWAMLPVWLKLTIVVLLLGGLLTRYVLNSQIGSYFLFGNDKKNNSSETDKPKTEKKNLDPLEKDEQIDENGTDEVVIEDNKKKDLQVVEERSDNGIIKGFLSTNVFLSEYNNQKVESINELERKITEFLFVSEQISEKYKSRDKLWDYIINKNKPRFNSINKQITAGSFQIKWDDTNCRELFKDILVYTKDEESRESRQSFNESAPARPVKTPKAQPTPVGSPKIATKPTTSPQKTPDKPPPLPKSATNN